MKTTIWLACATLLTLPACAQTNSGHEWKATIKVIDDTGAPMAGIDVTIGYYVNSVSTGTDGITDTNGFFMLSHKAQSEYADVSFEAKKDGYYSILQEVNLQPPFDAAKWNIMKPLTLKKINKPIEMYAKKYVMGLKLPEYNNKTGYDLMVGDWVAPHGKGITSDLFFEQNYTNISSREYYSEITVSFPKAGDGIQLYTIPDAELGSGFRSPHEAPTNNYLPELTRETSAKPGQPSKFEYDPNRIYLFRVRTVLDSKGNLVSAHYGKIYGDFMQFTYYLNPTPNSRNIEFDPKQNLLGGLKSFERVNQP